jgi:peptidoglycan/LPS O-acetylase OafA/YrhL
MVGSVAVRPVEIATAPASKNPSPERIDALTSLRFFACFFVVFYHAHCHFFGARAQLNVDMFEPILAFFFALSGFVLTHNYWNLNGKDNTISFYIFRYARMLPIHVIAAVLFVTLLPGLFRASGPVFFSNLTLTHSWLPWSQFFFSYNSPSWSSSTEMFFYLCFPLLLVCMRKAWFLPLVVTALPTALIILSCNAFHVPHMSAKDPCVVGLVFVHPLCRMFEFALGMVVAYAFRTHLKPMNLRPFAATALEFLGLGWVLAVAINGSAIRHFLMPFCGDAGSLWLQTAGLPVLGCGLLIAALATKRGVLGHILNWKFLVVLGECSYAIYLLHSLYLTYATVNFPSLTATDYVLFWATLLLAGYFVTTVLDPALRKLFLNVAFKLTGKDQGQNKAKDSATRSKSFISKYGFAALQAALLAVLVSQSVPALNRISPATANKISASCSVHNVQFGSYLLCKAAVAERDVDSARVNLVWEQLVSGKVNYHIKATALDQNDKEIGCRTYASSPRGETVDKGTLWEDNVGIYVPQGSQVKTIQLLVIRKHKQLPARTQNAMLTVPITSEIPPD